MKTTTILRNGVLLILLVAAVIVVFKAFTRLEKEYEKRDFPTESTSTPRFEEKELGEITIEKPYYKKELEKITHVDFKNSFFKEFYSTVDHSVDTLETVIVTPKYLGFTDEPVITHTMILRKAQALGLSPCPPKLAIVLAEKFDELVPKTQYPNIALIVATSPQISKELEYEDIFVFPFLRRDKCTDVQLKTMLSQKEQDWGLTSGWVFTRNK